MNLTKGESEIGKRPTASEAAVPRSTESEAIRRAQDGDAAAFEYLYKSHGRHVYSVCMRMLRNSADAEDLTQQVFMQLFRKIRTFRGESCFSSWLHRVTVNAVLMYLRRKKATENLVYSLDQSDTNGEDVREPGPGDTSMLSAIDRLNLKRSIRRLSPGHRKFFLLHHVIGFKHREIARLLKCTVGGSKSQAHKARRRLQESLLGEAHVESDTATA
jgi:RNA polymerase sigma-70 factor (ECF subfamily)